MHLGGLPQHPDADQGRHLLRREPARASRRGADGGPVTEGREVPRGDAAPARAAGGDGEAAARLEHGDARLGVLLPGLVAQGTKIVNRGADQVVNRFGGNCASCHLAGGSEVGHGLQERPRVRAAPDRRRRDRGHPAGGPPTALSGPIPEPPRRRILGCSSPGGLTDASNPSDPGLSVVAVVALAAVQLRQQQRARRAPRASTAKPRRTGKAVVVAAARPTVGTRRRDRHRSDRLHAHRPDGASGRVPGPVPHASWPPVLVASGRATPAAAGVKDVSATAGARRPAGDDQGPARLHLLGRLRGPGERRGHHELRRHLARGEGLGRRRDRRPRSPPRPRRPQARGTGTEPSGVTACRPRCTVSSGAPSWRPTARRCRRRRRACTSPAARGSARRCTETDTPFASG